MNVVKPNLVTLIAILLMTLSYDGIANAQEVKIGVVNIALLMEQAPQARVAMEGPWVSAALVLYTKPETCGSTMSPNSVPSKR